MADPDTADGITKKRLGSGFGNSHAFQRFCDHYGFNPTVDEWEKAITAIREGRALLVSKQPGGLEMWATEIRSIPVRMVFNPANQTLVTTNAPGRRALRKSNPNAKKYKVKSDA